MTDFLVPVCIGAVFIVVFASLGYVMDGKLHPALRADVRNALNRGKQRRSAISLFLAVFNRLFVSGATGRLSLGRALLALAVVLLIMLTGWAVVLPERAGVVFDYQLGWLDSIIMLFGILVMTNIIGCFFSLWETRLVAGWMAAADTPGQAGLLLLDVIATLLVYCAGLLIGILIHPATYSELPGMLQEFDGVGEVIHAFLSSFDLQNSGKSLLFCLPDDGFLDLRLVNDLLSIGFYAALLPSAWLWIFLLGIKAWPLFKWLGGVLHSDRYPVGAASTLGATLIALAAMTTIYFLQQQQCVWTSPEPLLYFP